ncbi:hypothetical protein AWENTII_010559 [Aspergillus wentii]
MEEQIALDSFTNRQVANPSQDDRQSGMQVGLSDDSDTAEYPPPIFAREDPLNEPKNLIASHGDPAI